MKSWACAGKDGSYGTSVERYKALDPASDIILAFRQNGRLLTPDHGYPLRIIIPGAGSTVLTSRSHMLHMFLD